MTRNPVGHARRPALGALVLALALAGASMGTAGASARDARVDKKKVTKVAVVVSDTETHGAEHAPGSMSMISTPDTAKAGKVKFKLTNEGSEEHELVVLKSSTAFDQLPVDAKNKVNEATAIGEVEGVAAGKAKTKTFKLKPGEYVLACNIAEHYGAGMRAAFTVT